MAGPDVTVTVNDTEAVFPTPSVAVHVTTALGGVAVNPDAGLQFTPMGCPPSVAVGVVYVTVSPSATVLSTKSAGKSSNTGGVVSTVHDRPSDPPTSLPWRAVTVKLCGPSDRPE